MPAPAFPAHGFGQADFVAIWTLGRRRPAGVRVAALARGVWGVKTVDADTLGRRNQRSLVLHRALCGVPIEVRVVCPDCGAENEAELPVDRLLEMPDPATTVSIETGQGPRHFGLPRVAQLAGLAGAGNDAVLALARGLAQEPGVELGPGDLALVSAAWEAADPAGAVLLRLGCMDCGRELEATVDPARFVARDLDLLAERLVREVDAIARAYGWSEAEILSLPPERRGTYVSLASARAAPGSRGLK